MREARAVMSDLAATGLNPEQLALIMELSAALTVEARPQNDEAADRRRAKDREYQAEKRRQNRQISADSADEDGQKEKSPKPPKEKHPPVTPKGVSPHRLPDDFAMPDEWKDWARDKRGWLAADIETESENFIDYWQARGRNSTSRDWRKTWQTWVRNSRRPDGPQRNTGPVKPVDRAEYEARLARIGRAESTGPPRQVGRLANNIMARVGNGNG